MESKQLYLNFFINEKVKRKTKADKIVNLMVHALTGPIVLFKGWDQSGMVPDWIRDRLPLDRLISLMQNKTTATDIEVMLYLSTASLANPISYDYVQIYRYLMTKVMSNKLKKKNKNFLKEIKLDTLTQEQEQKMNSLRFWIWKQTTSYMRIRT